jgi:hypothetical protein
MVLYIATKDIINFKGVVTILTQSCTGALVCRPRKGPGGPSSENRAYRRSRGDKGSSQGHRGGLRKRARCRNKARTVAPRCKALYMSQGNQLKSTQGLGTVLLTANRSGPVGTYHCKRQP